VVIHSATVTTSPAIRCGVMADVYLLKTDWLQNTRDVVNVEHCNFLLVLFSLYVVGIYIRPNCCC